MFADKKLARYMQRLFEDLEKDHNITRAVRRLHIKEVHLQRRGEIDGLVILRKARRLIR